MRMNHYQVPDGLEVRDEQLGMGAHTDYGIVTVLWADRVPGLEILRPDGSWLPVTPLPGALLINLGDLLARWTNTIGGCRRCIEWYHHAMRPTNSSVGDRRRSSTTAMPTR